MNFKVYEREAYKFAEYDNPVYPFLALAEEVGEFLTIPAKLHRGDDLENKIGLHGIQERMLKEAGDVLWQLNACLIEYGLSLEEAAELNLKKLQDRANRNMIKGEGDDR